MTWCEAARHDIYETIVDWAAHPPALGTEHKVIADIVDGKVFLEHPAFSTACRVTRAEAEACSTTLPIKLALMLYWDGFNVIASLERNAHRPYPSAVHYAPPTRRLL